MSNMTALSGFSATQQIIKIKPGAAIQSPTAQNTILLGPSSGLTQVYSMVNSGQKGATSADIQTNSNAKGDAHDHFIK